MPFRAILETLVHAHHPIVRGAIFCDDNGERVDAWVHNDADLDDLVLAGAAYAAVVRNLPASSALAVSDVDRTVWIATVEGGYYLLAVCAPTLAASIRRVLPSVVAALAAHM